jgi:hypothetical protein
VIEAYLGDPRIAEQLMEEQVYHERSGNP